ncbi:lipoate--protein ligase family protein [Candidatus Pacearchaeota archaeon]|nr:MAG: lipoate--protein ligase family protein [Candidatus Pacearchaeota archaeon]
MKLEARLVKLSARSGEFNNALDSYLIEQAKTQQLAYAPSPETRAAVFLTHWMPTISVGNTQKISLDVDKDACNRQGVSIVRRHSGGQAVYLDQNYLVISMLFPNTESNIFSDQNLGSLRERLSRTIARALNEVGVRAEFYPPDNVVVRAQSPRAQLKPIANAGQVVSMSYDGKLKGVFLQTSIRYSPQNPRAITNLLKINGNSLRGYERQISELLASVSEFSNATRQEVEEKLLSHLAQEYSLVWREHLLTGEEEQEIWELAEKEKARLRDREHYKSRGICYLTLDGKCLLDGASEWLEAKPSTLADSTLCARPSQPKEEIKLAG